MNPREQFDLTEAQAAYWARRDAGAGPGSGRRGDDRPSDEQWLTDLERRLVGQMAELHPAEYEAVAA